MKKILSLFLALLIAFSFTACSEAEDILSEVSDIAGEIGQYADRLESFAETEPSSEQGAETSPTDALTQAPSAETAVLPEEETVVDTAEISSETVTLNENGTYTSKEDVALFIHLFGRLPSNFITKNEARELGWEGGSLEPYAPGMCIGGDRFGNYEELLPTDRSYRECDIDTLGANSRGAKRIVFSDDGLIYYTDDHYESFELLYGEP